MKNRNDDDFTWTDLCETILIMRRYYDGAKCIVNFLLPFISDYLPAWLIKIIEFLFSI